MFLDTAVMGLELELAELNQLPDYRHSMGSHPLSPPLGLCLAHRPVLCPILLLYP